MSPLHFSQCWSENLSEEVLAALAAVIGEMQFGSIEIVIHEGRVLQIERREKLRFASPR